MHQKYPSSSYLTWSAELPSNLRPNELTDLSAFKGQTVVVTEKMDGENTTMYHDHIHARSITAFGVITHTAADKYTIGYRTITDEYTDPNTNTQINGVQIRHGRQTPLFRPLCVRVVGTR